MSSLYGGGQCLELAVNSYNSVILSTKWI